MPAPGRISLDAIVDAGRGLLDRDGLAGLSMQSVAGRLGVRAPSLYKHVSGRDALVRLLADDAVRDLAERLEDVRETDAGRRLRELAHAVRSFARERPAAYRLIFVPSAETERADPAAIVRASAPVLDAVTGIVGAGQALEAARLVTAWTTGFLLMELADSFRLGGDVDAAFEFGIARLASSLAAEAPTSRAG